jgi:predicted RND superfamily exporter protein
MGISFIGVKKTKTDVSEDNWFLEHDPMLQLQNEFEDIFGNNDMGAVLIEADDVFQPEILSKIRELSDELEQNVPYADEVTSLTHLEFTLGTENGIEIIDLIPEEIPTSKEELDKIRNLALSKKILHNKFISDDSKQTWILLRLKPLPDDWETSESYRNFVNQLVQNNPKLFAEINTKKVEAPDLLIGRIFTKIARQEKYAVLNPKTTGVPVLNIEKSLFFGKESPKLMKFGLLLTVLVLLISLRSLRGVVFPLISAAGAMLIVFGFQGFTGIKFDPMMVPLPLFLGLAVSVGYSIHIFSFFNRKMKETGIRKESAIFAVEEAGWPILFTALTTVGALMSFLFIDVRVLRWVGLTSAGLVAVTYFLVLILLPSFLSIGKNKAVKIDKAKKNSKIENLMERLNIHVMKNPKKIIIGFTMIFILCIVGISKVEVSFDMIKTIGMKVPHVKRFSYIGDTKIGSIYSYNMMIELPNPGDAKNPVNLRKFAQVEEEIKRYKFTKKISSILDIVRDLNQVLNDGKPEFHKIPSINDIPEYRDADLSMIEMADMEKMILAQTMLLYENAGGSDAEKWSDYDNQRLNMQVDIMHYTSAELVKNFADIEELVHELFPNSRVIFAGQLAKYAVMQETVAVGQIKSFLIALCIIAILLMLVFGSIRTGLIGMIPNVAPALVVGGLMGFLKIPLDMITVTIMPMLLGLAVDDTIHFINHSHLEFNRSGEYSESLRTTTKTIGSALFLTSIVLIMNFSAYFISDANIYVNLGILSVAGIASALLADLYVTPILLNVCKVYGKEK